MEEIILGRFWIGLIINNFIFNNIQINRLRWKIFILIIIIGVHYVAKPAKRNIYILGAHCLATVTPIRYPLKKFGVQ